MTKSIINTLVRNQNPIALSAIAITTIGGSVFIAWCAREMNKDAEAINEIVSEFNKNYAS